MTDDASFYLSREIAFCEALENLPEVPPIPVLDMLEPAAKWPQDWERGKALQRKHGLEAIPPKAEYESGAGVWSRIRQGLLEKPND